MFGVRAERGTLVGSLTMDADLELYDFRGAEAELLSGASLGDGSGLASDSARDLRMFDVLRRSLIIQSSRAT